MLNEDILETLKANSYKITTFRKRLVDIFCEHNHSLLSAKIIKETLLETYGHEASFDTIYKNLTIFSNLNIVHEKFINHESFYVLSATLEEHHHFICLNCGEAFDIDDYCTIDKLKDYYNEYEITGHLLEVYGICKECKKHNR